MADEGIGREFMLFTRFEFLDSTGQQMHLPQPPLEMPPRPGKSIMRLPRPDAVATAPCDLRQAIEQRRSLRQYRADALTLAELSYLLWSTQGVREVLGHHATLRTVPSAGARHALETYVLANRVDGVPPGLYRFLAIEHSLQDVDRSEDGAGRLVAACLGQGFVGLAAAAFFWTASAERMTWRYGERGYRYLLLDAGHACQNLYLAAESIGCGACAVGAFDDEALDAALGVDGVGEFSLYAAAVGKKP